MSRVDDVTLESSGSNKLQLTICNMKLCRMVGMKMVNIFTLGKNVGLYMYLSFVILF